MSDFSGNTIKLLRKAAGESLTAQREAQGFHSTHAAWKAIHKAGVKIRYYRYQRLEMGDLPKNELEMFGVSRFLNIDLDCWL